MSKDTFKKEKDPIVKGERLEEGVEVTSVEDPIDPIANKPSVETTSMSVIKPVNNSTLALAGSGKGTDSSMSISGFASAKLASYSGGDGSSLVGDTTSNQIVEEAHQPRGRFNKKIDLPVKDVNSIVAEQVEVTEQTAPDLVNSREETEGRADRVLNDNARLQKASGTQAAERSFVRSLDEILRDELIFTHGQSITMHDRGFLEAPKKYSYANAKGKILEANRDVFPNSTVKRPKGMVRGNYVPRELRVTLKEIDGRIVISDMDYEVDDHSIVLPHNQHEILDNSATHARIHGNYSELKRQNMEDVASDETQVGFTPLARAINEPTANLGLLKDIDLDIGNTVFIAHRKISEALSYQINRTSKDGDHLMSPIREAVLGAISKETRSTVFENHNLNVFDTTFMQQGASSLMIAINDSVRKYVSKGVFLNLKAKSFAQYLQVAEVNAPNFRANSLFVDTVNKQQVFSTIDKDYDPLAPVFITDNLLTAHPYDFNDFINVKGRKTNLEPNERQWGMGYNYHTGTFTNRLTRVEHPLVSGIYDWFVEHGGRLFESLKSKKDDKEVKLVVPIGYSTTKLNLWSLIVLAATEQISRQRLVTMREIFMYQSGHGYPFEDISVELKTIFNSSPLNYTSSGIDSPLKVSRMDQTRAITWTMPELFHPYDEMGDDIFRFISPFYFNEESFDFNEDGTWSFNPRKNFYSFPIVRSGVTTEALDKFTKMEPKQVRLAYDMLTRLPILKGEANTGRVYKYDMTTQGVFAFDDTTNDGLTLGDIMIQPRQLGLSLVLPFGYATFSNELGSKPTRKTLTDKFDGGMSDRVKIFFTTGAPVLGNDRPTINGAVNGLENINDETSANFKQSWIVNNSGDASETTVVNGIQLSLSSPFTTQGVTGEGDIRLIPGTAVLNPFVNGLSPNVTDDYKVIGAESDLVNFSSPINTRINLLPYIVSPWDSKPKPSRTGENGMEADPYMFAHMFNFVGFYAIDFYQESQIRLSKIKNSGPFFISDRWIEQKFNKEKE